MKMKITSGVLLCAILLGMLFAIDVNIYAVESIVDDRDKTWYDANKKELIISDTADFLAFMYELTAQTDIDDGGSNGNSGDICAASPQKTNGIGVAFAGVTVKLDADIIVNSNLIIPKDFEQLEDPKCVFKTAEQKSFGGIFDGQGHTISGVVIDSQSLSGGSLFGLAMSVNGGEVTVKNLSIKNSLIKNSTKNAGSIFSAVAYGSNARIENVYSEMGILSTMSTKTTSGDYSTTNIETGAGKKSDTFMGGLVGSLGGTLDLNSSVYAGSMQFNAMGDACSRRTNGGMIGVICETKYESKVCAGSLIADSIGYFGSFDQKWAERFGKLAGRMENHTSALVMNSLFFGDASTKGDHVSNIVGGISVVDEGAITVLNVKNCVYTPVMVKYLDNDVEKKQPCLNFVVEVPNQKGKLMCDYFGSTKIIDSNDFLGILAKENLERYYLDNSWSESNDGSLPLPTSLAISLGIIKSNIGDEKENNEYEVEEESDSIVSSDVNQSQKATENDIIDTENTLTESVTDIESTEEIKNAKGCSSSLSVISFAVVFLIGVACVLIVKKRKC